MSPTAPMQLAHFEFDPETDRLGEGPLSEVYRARDTVLDRLVALKILRANAELDPQADERFQREGRHTAKLDHEGITRIYELGTTHEEPQRQYIAMELLEGRTFDKVVRDKPPGFQDCFRYALQLTEVLGVVHRSGLIHRDLKPANVLLQHDGKLKLLDFGIARARDEASITQHGMLVGTVLYMSPEQVRGDRLERSSDIFALGSVLYHITTGQLPFPGESFPEVCMAILDGRLQLRPSEVREGFPPQLEVFLLRCLDPDPAERYPDAEAAFVALQALQDEYLGSSRRVRVTGTLLLPHFTCGGADPSACHHLAGVVHRDLVAELDKNRELTVQARTAREAGGESDHRWVLHGQLEVEADEAVLSLSLDHLERIDGLPQVMHTSTDQVRVRSEDEVVLWQDLVSAGARSVKRLLEEGPRLEPAVVSLSQQQLDQAREKALEARDLLHRGRSKHLIMARRLLDSALEADRYCALAHAIHSELLVRKFLYWDGDRDYLEQSRVEADRALKLDPDCAEAHTALGFSHHLSGHLEDARREYRLAIGLDPEEWFAYRLLGALQVREGNYKHAAPTLQRAIGLRPQQIGAYDHLYNTQMHLEREEEALETADDGISAARKQLAAVPDDMDARVHMALLYARLGRADKARAAVDEALALAPKDGFVAFHAAVVRAVIGDHDDAVHALEIARDRGYFLTSELGRNADFDVLRGRPDFQAIVS